MVRLFVQRLSLDTAFAGMTVICLTWVVTMFKTFLRHPRAWPMLTLLLLLIVSVVFNPGFLHIEWRDGHLYGSLIDILNRAALVVQDGVAVHANRFPMLLAILAALGVAVACGLWNAVLVARIGMQPIIATLILMVVGRGIAQLITGGQIITIYYIPFFFLGSGYLAGLPFSLLIVALVYGALHLAMTRTALGLFIQARKLTVWVYAFCGLCAGVAGLLISSHVKIADGNNAGQLLELDAILAVTLGGTALTGGHFSLFGSVIGALIIQTLSYAIYSLGVPPEINLVVKAVVVFAVMLLQSAEFRATVGTWVVRPVQGQP